MSERSALDRARVLVTGGSGFIGTNLVEALTGRVGAILNFDVVRPNREDHAKFWMSGDVLDANAVRRAFDECAPTHVVHLAARTDMDGPRVEDYRVNVHGLANVLDTVRSTARVERSVWVSTQFVFGPGSDTPTRPDDFRPHTVYGQSKVSGEKIVRNGGLNSTWTIVRPTNVWGPWHPRYPSEFWRVLKKGYYLHPGHKPVIRSYGYVGNVVHQIMSILEAPREKVHARVFYVGDPSIDLREWCDAFSIALTGRPVRIVPRVLLRSLGIAGDLLLAVGIDTPIFSTRVRSMTVDYPTPMEGIFDVSGPSPFSLEAGVAQTVQWLRDQDPFWR